MFNINFAKEQARIYLSTLFLGYLRAKNPIFNHVDHIIIETTKDHFGKEYLQCNDLFKTLNLFFVCKNSEKLKQLMEFFEDTLKVETLSALDLAQDTRDDIIDLFGESIVGLSNPRGINKLLNYFAYPEKTYDDLLTKALPDIYPLYLQFIKAFQDLHDYFEVKRRHVDKNPPVHAGTLFQDAILRYSGLTIELDPKGWKNYRADFDLKTGRYIAHYSLYRPEDLDRVIEAVTSHWQAETQIKGGGVRFFIDPYLIHKRLAELKIICVKKLIEEAEIEKRKNLYSFENHDFRELSFFYKSSLMTPEKFITMINTKIEELNSFIIKDINHASRYERTYFQILMNHFSGPQYPEMPQGVRSHIKHLTEGEETTSFMKQVTASQRVDIGDYACCFSLDSTQLPIIQRFLNKLRDFALSQQLNADLVFLANEQEIVVEEFEMGCFGPYHTQASYYAVIIKEPMYLMLLDYLLPEKYRKNAELWLDIFKQSFSKNQNPRHLFEAIETCGYQNSCALQKIYHAAFPECAPSLSLM